jgi:hypothetical protein
LCKIVQLHYHLWYPVCEENDCGSKDKGNGTKIDYSEDFHTFGFEWDRCTLKWLIDGEVVKTIGQWYTIDGELITKQSIKPMQVVLRNEFYPKGLLSIKINLAIQTGNNTPDETTPFPNALIVDYVRYFEPKY